MPADDAMIWPNLMNVGPEVLAEHAEQHRPRQLLVLRAAAGDREPQLAQRGSRRAATARSTSRVIRLNAQIRRGTGSATEMQEQHRQDGEQRVPEHAAPSYIAERRRVQAARLRCACSPTVLTRRQARTRSEASRSAACTRRSRSPSSASCSTRESPLRSLARARHDPAVARPRRPRRRRCRRCSASARCTASTTPPRVVMPAEIVDDLLAALAALSKLQRFPLAIEAIGMAPGDELELRGDLRVRAVRTFHPVPSLAYIVVRRVSKLRAGVPRPARPRDRGAPPRRRGDARARGSARARLRDRHAGLRARPRARALRRARARHGVHVPRRPQVARGRARRLPHPPRRGHRARRPLRERARRR